MAATSPRGKSWRVMRQQFGLVPHCRVRIRAFSTVLWNRHRSAGICSNERYGTQPSHRTRALRCSPVTFGRPPPPLRGTNLTGFTGLPASPPGSPEPRGETRIPRGSTGRFGIQTERKMPDLPGSLGFRESSRLTQLARQALPQIRASARCLAPRWSHSLSTP